VLGFKACRHRFEAGDGASPVDDQDGRAALQAIDQRAEFVLCFGNAGFFHLAKIT